MIIFVANLAYAVADHSLRELFEGFGTVARAYVVTERETGASRGFGFVEMPDAREAMTAIEALDGTEVLGRQISVRESVPTRTRETANR